MSTDVKIVLISRASIKVGAPDGAARLCQDRVFGAARASGQSHDSCHGASRRVAALDERAIAIKTRARAGPRLPLKGKCSHRAEKPQAAFTTWFTRT